MSFSKPGTYTYHCVIHPTMNGTVEVLASGSIADRAGDVAARKSAEQAQWLTEGEAAAQRLTATPPASTVGTDGTTTWTVQMGTSTTHTDVFAFAPVPANVKAGDKITFVNNSSAPHTASFFNNTTPIRDPTDPANRQAIAGQLSSAAQRHRVVQHRNPAPRRTAWCRST